MISVILTTFETCSFAFQCTHQLKIHPTDIHFLYYFLFLQHVTLHYELDSQNWPTFSPGNVLFASLIIILTNHQRTYLAWSELVLAPEECRQCWHWSSDKAFLHQRGSRVIHPRIYVPKSLVFHFSVYLFHWMQPIFCWYYFLRLQKAAQMYRIIPTNVFR